MALRWLDNESVGTDQPAVDQAKGGSPGVSGQVVICGLVGEAEKRQQDRVRGSFTCTDRACARSHRLRARRRAAAPYPGRFGGARRGRATEVCTAVSFTRVDIGACPAALALPDRVVRRSEVGEAAGLTGARGHSPPRRRIVETARPRLASELTYMAMTAAGAGKR